MQVPCVKSGFRLIMPAFLVIALIAGCSSVNDTGGMAVRDVDPSRDGINSGTGPESRDVLVIGDKMMRSLLSAPVIANAAQPPAIALISFQNKSRFPLDGGIFLSKLRVELNSKAAGRMLFLARERMEEIQDEREAKRQGEVAADPDRKRAAPAGADYFLTGKLEGLAKTSSDGQSDYMLYTFSLVDTESSVIVWEDQFEVKRIGRQDASYR